MPYKCKTITAKAKSTNKYSRQAKQNYACPLALTCTAFNNYNIQTHGPTVAPLMWHQTDYSSA